MKKFFEKKTVITRTYGSDNIAALDSYEDELIMKANEDLKRIKALMPAIEAQTDKFYDELDGNINSKNEKKPLNTMFIVTKKETTIDSDCCSCNIL